MCIKHIMKCLDVFYIDNACPNTFLCKLRNTYNICIIYSIWNIHTIHDAYPCFIYSTLINKTSRFILDLYFSNYSYALLSWHAIYLRNLWRGDFVNLREETQAQKTKTKLNTSNDLLKVRYILLWCIINLIN